MSQNDTIDRLRLTRTENVGPITYRQLIARFGNASDAIKALPTLAKRGGRRRTLKVPDRQEVEMELDQLDRFGGRMIFLGDETYPDLLAAIDDAPPAIAVLGHPAVLSQRAVAIVGSRNASTNGKRLATSFAKALGEAGFLVVSGLALGIDAAAHKGALETGTAAVTAGGIDVVYPRENADLHREIAARGAILAEMPFGTVPQARHFPRRNRIISGLTRATLVIEATQRSGSLITARFASEQGREVMAIPGSPLDPRARGANDLIRKGAALIETPQEAIAILSELHELSQGTGKPFGDPPPSDPEEGPLRDARSHILGALGATPVLIDELSADLGISMSILAAAILDLELAGAVERLAGGRIVRLTDQVEDNIGENFSQFSLFDSKD